MRPSSEGAQEPLGTFVYGVKELDTFVTRLKEPLDCELDCGLAPDTFQRIRLQGLHQHRTIRRLPLHFRRGSLGHKETGRTNLNAIVHKHFQDGTVH